MAGLAKVEEMCFPATLTTKDGMTYTPQSAEEMSGLGLTDKSWEAFRGGYREQGCRPYKDGRISVGRHAKAVEKVADSVMGTEEDLAALVDDPPASPKPPKTTKKKASRRSRSVD